MAAQKTGAAPKRRKRRRQRGGPPYLVILVLGAVALLAVALYAVYQGSGAAPGAKGPNVPVTVSGRPAVEVDQKQVDLGYIKLNKTVQASFQIQNVGDQPLKITELPTIEVVEGC